MLAIDLWTSSWLDNKCRIALNRIVLLHGVMQTRSADHLPKRIRKVNIKEIVQAAWCQTLGKVQSFLKMFCFSWALLGWIEILRRQYARKEKPNTCASSSKAAKQIPQTEHSRVHFNVSLPSVLQTKYYQNILKHSKKWKGLKHKRLTLKIHNVWWVPSHRIHRSLVKV